MINGEEAFAEEGCAGTINVTFMSGETLSFSNMAPRAQAEDLLCRLTADRPLPGSAWYQLMDGQRVVAADEQLSTSGHYSAVVSTFRWGRHSLAAVVSDLRILHGGIEGYAAALSAPLSLTGVQCWCLQRRGRANEEEAMSDAIGVCCASAVLDEWPGTPGFNSQAVWFSSAPHCGSVYRNVTSVAKTAPLRDDGALLEITVDHNSNAIVFRAPKLPNPDLGVVPRLPGGALHLFINIGRGNCWEVVGGARE